MRRLTILLAFASLAACGPIVTEENDVEICETALLRNVVATSMTNRQISISAGMDPEGAILGSIFQAAAARAALEQAMGPGVTITEYCESKSFAEIQSMATDADTAVAMYAGAAGIPRTVAEDQIDRAVERMRRNMRTGTNSTNIDDNARSSNDLDEEEEFTAADNAALRAECSRSGLPYPEVDHCMGIVHHSNYGDREFEDAFRQAIISGDWSAWTVAECNEIRERYVAARARCLEGKLPENDPPTEYEDFSNTHDFTGWTESDCRNNGLTEFEARVCVDVVQIQEASK